MSKTNFELELRAQSAAERIGGKVEKIGDGYSIETTLGSLVKYNLGRGFEIDLNTHCALVALSTPFYENELDIRLRFVEERDAEWKAEGMKREIADEVGDDGDIDGEADVFKMDIGELIQSDERVWLNIDKDEQEIDLDGWFHIVNHHHMVKVEPPCPF